MFSVFKKKRYIISEFIILLFDDHKTAHQTVTFK